MEFYVRVHCLFMSFLKKAPFNMYTEVEGEQGVENEVVKTAAIKRKQGKHSVRIT